MSKTFLKLWNASEELFKKIENLEKENKKLETKLKIAEEYLDVISRGVHFGDNIEEHLKILATEALQNIKEVK